MAQLDISKGILNSGSELSLMPSAVIEPAHLSPCPQVWLDSGSEAKEARKSLQWFLGELKGFIVETQFKSGEFRKYAEGLERFISAINRVVKAIRPHNEILTKELQFATYFFDSMRDAAIQSRKYNFWGRTEEFLVINLIEINVAFLALCDSQGMLDRSILGHREKLSNYWDLVSQWNESFKRTANVSEEIKDFFKTERAKAGRTYIILKSQAAG